MELTPEAKKLFDDSFEIVKADKLYQRIRKATAVVTPPTVPTGQPNTGGPTPPPANPANPPNTPPTKKSAYWGLAVESDEPGNSGNTGS